MPNNGFEIQMTDFILEQNLYVGFIYLFEEYMHKMSNFNFRAKTPEESNDWKGQYYKPRKPLIFGRIVWFFFHFGFIDYLINEILPENQCIFT